MTLVVDASAVAAILFDEPESATIRAHIRGETVIAPHLIDYELANASWKRIRKNPASEFQVLGMLDGLNGIGMRRVAVPPTDVAALAVKTGLTAYDAAYLWLAMAEDIELVTLDNQLARVNQQLREFGDG